MCRILVICLLGIYFQLIAHFTVVHGLSINSEMLPDSYIDELIAENYIQNMMRRWKLMNVISDNADATIYADLKGLYKTLKYHPGLMERRLQVGGRNPPPLPEQTNPQSIPINKRTTVFDIGLAQPVCPFKTEWRLIYNAKDMNNTDVEVFQPSDDVSTQFQWFYTVSCDRIAMAADQQTCPFCCRGIHSRRYASMCITRESYVMALVRRHAEINFDWNYIKVDSSCNCAISPTSH